MKKFAIFAAFAAFAFASEGIPLSNAIFFGLGLVGAGIGFGVAALGGAIGMGHASAATIAGIARNPGLAGKLQTTMFIALALIEAQVIYALVVTLLIFYANPFLDILGLVAK